MAFLPINHRPQPSTGITITNAVASLPPILNAIITEKIIIRGLRTAVLISIMNAI